MSLLFKRSTIQWCEEKTSSYKYSSYIAEFYNSLTGFCLCLSACIFYYNYKKSKLYINKLENSLILLFLVGIGTFLFHSTLLYIFQMTDEIPMLLLSCEYYYLVSSFKLSKYTYYPVTNTFKYNVYGISVIVFIVGFVNNFLQVLIFQSSLIYIIGLILYKFYLFNLSIDIYLQRLYKSKESLQEQYIYHYHVHNKLKIVKKNIRIISELYNNIKNYKKIGFILTASSVIVWFLDKNYCEYINIHGHAIWHVLTSIGLFYLNKIMITYLQLIYQVIYYRLKNILKLIL
jgi:hypothetical protein